MARKLHAAALMRTMLLTLLVVVWATLVSVAFAQKTAQSPKTVKEVMTTMTVPASDAIFAGAAEPPTNAEGWAAVRAGAVTLAESGRLLMTSALARDKGPWMEMAGDQVKAADAAAKVADAKDQQALEQTSDRIYATCKTCHDRYMAAN